MLVREVLNKEVITVRPSTSLGKLLDLFKGFHTFPMVPVVNGENRLVGKVSFENLVEVFHPHGIDTKRLLETVSFLDREEPLDIFKIEITPEMGVLLVVADFMDTRVITIRACSIIKVFGSSLLEIQRFYLE
ncbi:MAG: CBS domain-containing protein [Thermodesulfobacteriota bacterium]